MKRNFILVLIFLSYLCIVGQAFGEQAYPTKAIDLIVPYNPGGGSDLAARLLSTYFSKTFDVKLNVINKVGGAGTIGLQAALSAKPDGYTMLMDTHGLGSMIAFYEGKYPFDWQKRTWIGRIVQEPMVYVIRLDGPWNNLKELAEFIKKNPKKLRWGVTGLSGSGYAAGVQFFNVSNIPVEDINIVMFQGNPEVVAALAGGHIDAASVQYSQAVGMVQGKKIRAIGAAGDKRLSLFPDMATAADQGYPMLDIMGYQGIGGPSDLPKDVVNFWAKSLEKTCMDPEFVKQSENIQQVVAYLGPKDYQEFVEKQYNQYLKLVPSASQSKK